MVNMNDRFIISTDAQRWLETGERGVSSEAIFSHLTGLNLRRVSQMSTPHDPSDLRRCRLLLQAVPEFKERFHEMRRLSETWAVLLDHWIELCKLFDEEAPDWATRHRQEAHRTYRRMKELGL